MIPAACRVVKDHAAFSCFLHYCTQCPVFLQNRVFSLLLCVMAQDIIFPEQRHHFIIGTFRICDVAADRIIKPFTQFQRCLQGDQIQFFGKSPSDPDFKAKHIIPVEFEQILHPLDIIKLRMQILKILFRNHSA